MPPRAKGKRAQAKPTGQAASISARLQRKGMNRKQATAFAKNACKRGK